MSQENGREFVISKKWSKLLYKYCHVSKRICVFQFKADLFTQKRGIWYSSDKKRKNDTRLIFEKVRDDHIMENDIKINLQNV